MIMAVRFDSSLPRLCEIAAKHIGADVLSRSAIIRDSTGRLSMVLPIKLEKLDLETFSNALRETLGNYARPDRIVSDIGERGSQRLLDEAEQQPLIKVSNWTVRVLD